MKNNEHTPYKHWKTIHKTSQNNYRSRAEKIAASNEQYFLKELSSNEKYFLKELCVL